jgi:hypothetical protein
MDVNVVFARADMRMPDDLHDFCVVNVDGFPRVDSDEDRARVRVNLPLPIPDSKGMQDVRLIQIRKRQEVRGAFDS